MQLERSTKLAALTLSAYGLSGIVGFALIPFFLDAYETAGFGVITLARLLLPVGLFAILDCGVGEIVTQVIARARGRDDWSSAGGQVGASLCASVVLGLVLGAGLLLLAGVLATAFRIPDSLVPAFIGMLTASALLMPWLCVSLVIEGIAKGFEDFRLLRSLEIGNTVCFAAAALALMKLGDGVQTIHYAFLACASFRSLVLLVALLRKGRIARLALRVSMPERYVIDLATLYTKGRLISVATWNGSSLVVSLLFGPSGLAVYEIIQKIPRFVRATYSMASAVLVPVAARIDGSGDRQRFQRVGRLCISIMAFFGIPPLIALMVFSDRILLLWLGPQFASLYPWFCVACLWPIMALMMQSAQAILIGRVNFLGPYYNFNLQVGVLSFALSLVLSIYLREIGFVVGISLATLLLFHRFVKLFSAEAEIPVSDCVRLFGLHILVASLLAPLFVLLSTRTPPSALVTGCLIAAFCVSSWAIAYSRMSEDHKSAVRRMVASMSKTRDWRKAGKGA